MRLSVEFMLEVVLVGGGLHWAHWKLYYLQVSGRGRRRRTESGTYRVHVFIFTLQNNCMLS